MACRNEMNDFLNDLDGMTDKDEEGSLSERDESPPGKRRKIQMVKMLSHHQP